MSKYTIEDTTLTAIADALRAAEGSAEMITPERSKGSLRRGKRVSTIGFGMRFRTMEAAGITILAFRVRAGTTTLFAQSIR